MKKRLAAIEVALRVLTAAVYNQRPDPSDVQALYEYAEQPKGLEIDQLACAVIEEAIKQNSEARAKAADAASGVGPNQQS